MADGAAISASAEEWSFRGVLFAIICVLLWVIRHQATRLAEIEQEREAERNEFKNAYLAKLKEGKDNG